MNVFQSFSVSDVKELCATLLKRSVRNHSRSAGGSTLRINCSKLELTKCESSVANTSNFAASFRAFFAPPRRKRAPLARSTRPTRSSRRSTVSTLQKRVSKAGRRRFLDTMRKSTESNPESQVDFGSNSDKQSQGV